MKRIISVFVLVVFLCCGTVWADAPAASTFAPAKDLASQVSGYVDDLEKSIADKADFEDSKVKIARDASTLSVIALTLGVHDKDSKYQKAAPALLKACQETANATDYDAAKAGIDAIKKAVGDASGDPSGMKWEKVASLKELMEAVPLINTKLKRYVRGKRLKSKAEDTQGYTAVIAAIAQASISNADETEKPTEVEAWEKFCCQMRDAATKTNKAIGTEDEAKVEKAMEELQKSCDDCHEVFHKTAATEAATDSEE